MRNVLINFLLLLGLTLNVYADDSGFYVGIGPGYSTVSAKTQGSYSFNAGTANPATQNSVATTVFLGYDFNHFLGLEANYAITWNAQYANNFNLNQQLLGGDLLFHLPFNLVLDSLSGLDVFAKIGLYYNMYNLNNLSPSCQSCSTPNTLITGASALYGLGLEYGFENVGYRLEWNYSPPIINNNALELNSNSYYLSILYHF
jgi:hypothetical protein